MGIFGRRKLRWGIGKWGKKLVLWRLFELGFCLCNFLQKGPPTLVQEKVISMTDGGEGRSSMGESSVEGSVLRAQQCRDSNLERGHGHSESRGSRSP